ncbi:MAG TPA: phospholipase D-like domain-containing protein, partial [Candidatus Binatia bacterium]|nr:phospholipase D-like domain-containing protein [Candidatus Binatia bacterium]
MTRDLIYSIIGGVVVAVATVSAGHALLTKRDPRAALGWIAACVLFPLVGPLLYFAFGINRIRMRAQKLVATGADGAVERIEDTVPAPGVPGELSQLERVGWALTGVPLSTGNRVELLHNGEAAFPAMLAAIERAREEIVLATYIFETNDTGRRFVDALAAARDRGVRVLVLIDGIGELYSFPWAARLLRKRDVRVLRFLPPRLLPPRLQINLRNHRKVLVVDGETAFTGGMNIGDRYLAERSENPRRVVDVHARVTGPVVHHLRRAFVEDWRWVSGETLPEIAPTTGPTGAAACRVIADGPSEDLEKIAMLLVAAISVATRRVCIMTPYFLPPRSLITALQAASLRGVEVRVVLPEKNNLPYVHWATRKMLWELLGRGVRVYLQPPPFVHTKLFRIDDDYVLLGSANIDPRSLRLNFELVLEAYDAELAADV